MCKEGAGGGATDEPPGTTVTVDLGWGAGPFTFATLYLQISFLKK